MMTPYPAAVESSNQRPRELAGQPLPCGEMHKLPALNLPILRAFLHVWDESQTQSHFVRPHRSMGSCRRNPVLA